jgi:hypothetical protein
LEIIQFFQKFPLRSIKAAQNFSSKSISTSVVTLFSSNLTSATQKKSFFTPRQQHLQVHLGLELIIYIFIYNICNIIIFTLGYVRHLHLSDAPVFAIPCRLEQSDARYVASAQSQPRHHQTSICIPLQLDDRIGSTSAVVYWELLMYHRWSSRHQPSLHVVSAHLSLHHHLMIQRTN